MSIQSEIGRIVAAKEAIKTAINSKGGNLTANDTIDKYAEAVEAIEQGVDTSDATATAGDILIGNTAYVDGEKLSGSMTNNGAVSKTLTPSETSYTVPKGYHNGAGKVQIVTETKTATPTKSTQNVTPSSGKVLSKVTVNPIPAAYITTNDATAAAEDIRAGKTAYVNGTKLTGTYVPDEGLDTSDATAQAGDILAGKTAYVDGEKITGTLVVDSGGVSGGIAPFTVAYGATMPSTVAENQIFVITEQIPTVAKSYCQSVDGIEISISYTGESVDDVFGGEGSMELSLIGDSDTGIKINLGNGIMFNTGIAASVIEDGYEYGQNFVYLYDSSSIGVTLLASYFGHDGTWVKISNAEDDFSGYSLRRARRT